MGTKRNPGRFDRRDKLADDEPYFVLRAKDPVAPAVIEEWARQRARRPDNRGNPKIAEALRCAAALREWRARNVRPDEPDLGVPGYEEVRRDEPL